MAKNILTAEITIRGTRPILWHRFGPDALPLEKQERTGVAGNDPEEWRRTCLITKDGQLYLPPTYVFSTCKNGGQYTKRGKSSLLKPIAATLQVVDDKVLVDRYFPGFPNGHAFDVKVVDSPSNDSELPVYLDIQGVVNPNTKSRNVRYRIAASSGWRATFHVMWDKTIVSRAEMEAVWIDAGKLVGIGNGRAVGYGRFEVEQFAVSES